MRGRLLAARASHAATPVPTARMGNEASVPAASRIPPLPSPLAHPDNVHQQLADLYDADADADADSPPVTREPAPPSLNGGSGGGAHDVQPDAEPSGGGVGVGAGALEWLKEGARYASGIPLPSTTQLLGRLVGAGGGSENGERRSPHQSDKSSSSRSWSWSRPSSDGGENGEQSADSSPVTPVEPDLSVFTDEVLHTRLAAPHRPHTLPTLAVAAAAALIRID